MRIDAENNFAYEDSWLYSIHSELGQVKDYKTFRLLKPRERLTGYTRIPDHVVFDVKFDGQKKTRIVADGNHTDPPQEDIYSEVVKQFCVRLGYMAASSNNLQVCTGDVGHAFLHGKTRELVFIIAGPEFGELAGIPLIIQRGLYELRSSSARFHEHLSDKIRAMGFIGR